MNYKWTSEHVALAEGDTPDLDIKDRKKIVVVGSTSPEVDPESNRYATGAQVGDFVVPQGDLRKVFKGSVGFEALLVGFSLSHPEYEPGRGAFVMDHGVKKPPGAKWIDKKKQKGVEKSGFYLENGNKVVPTITAYLVTKDEQGHTFGCTYDFYSSAYKVGREFAVRASRLKATLDIDGAPKEVKSLAAGKWKFTSRLERKDNNPPYPLPVITLIAKLGAENGPSPHEWVLVQKLRNEFKAGEVGWMPMEALEPPAPGPEWPVLDAKPKAKAAQGDEAPLPPDDYGDGPGDDYDGEF
jgi:hypothetical protein